MLLQRYSISNIMESKFLTIKLWILLLVAYKDWVRSDWSDRRIELYGLIDFILSVTQHKNTHRNYCLHIVLLEWGSSPCMFTQQPSVTHIIN